MTDRMHKRSLLARVAGATAVAFLMGATPVWAQSTTTTPAQGESTAQPAEKQPGDTKQDKGGDSSATTNTTGAAIKADDGASSGSSGASGSSDSSGATGTGSSTSSATGSTNAAGAAVSSGATGAAASGQVGKADRQLMRDLAHSNLGEIAAAQMALEKSQSDDVKKFAQQMVDDHTKAHDQLKQLAEQKGVQLPTKPDAKHQALAKRLKGLSGEKFDEQYMTHAGMMDHRKADKLVDRGSARAKDPDLKALIAQMEPTIEQHLKMAGDMHKGMGSTGSSGSSSGKSGSDSDKSSK